MQVAQHKDGTISFLRVHLRSADHNVELFAVPLMGTDYNYKALNDHLHFSEHFLQKVVLNSYVVDAITDYADADSSEIGHGMWSDMAHIIGHRVLDECIPYTEYKNAAIDFEYAKKLMKLSDKNHAKIYEDGKKVFEDYATTSNPRMYRKIVKALLTYKYSPFMFWSASFKYAKVAEAMASHTVEKITKDHYLYNACAILDPHAINKTVAKLKKQGYRVTKTEYIPFIELSNI
ncbi:hypothetical protein SEA_ATUIN_199 [Arthrobacter phage Atuin]|nr:hypothetical protein SEA_ATUIN_298 [Arthrobacter phage Atuin]